MPAPSVSSKPQRYTRNLLLGSSEVMPGLPRIAVTETDDQAQIAFGIQSFDDPDHFAGEILAVVIHRVLGWVAGGRVPLSAVDFPWVPPTYAASISAAYFSPIARRRSLFVGVSSSPPGVHASGSTAKYLISSTRESRALARSTPSWMAVQTSGHRVSSDETSAAIPCSSAKAVSAAGSSVMSATTYGRRIAHGDHGGNQRECRLHRALDGRGGHVLARGVDDQVFLTIDDRHEAVVINRGDVSGVEPATVGECRRCLLRVAPVAPHQTGRTAVGPVVVPPRRS